MSDRLIEVMGDGFEIRAFVAPIAGEADYAAANYGYVILQNHHTVVQCVNVLRRGSAYVKGKPLVVNFTCDPKLNEYLN